MWKSAKSHLNQTCWTAMHYQNQSLNAKLIFSIAAHPDEPDRRIFIQEAVIRRAEKIAIRPLRRRPDGGL